MPIPYSPRVGDKVSFILQELHKRIANVNITDGLEIANMLIINTLLEEPVVRPDEVKLSRVSVQFSSVTASDLGASPLDVFADSAASDFDSLWKENVISVLDDAARMRRNYEERGECRALLPDVVASALETWVEDRQQLLTLGTCATCTERDGGHQEDGEDPATPSKDDSECGSVTNRSDHFSESNSDFSCSVDTTSAKMLADYGTGRRSTLPHSFAPSTPNQLGVAPGHSTSDNKDTVLYAAQQARMQSHKFCRQVYEQLYALWVPIHKDLSSLLTYTLVVRCASCASVPATTSVSSIPFADNVPMCCFVIGCSPAQWNFLLNGPLACACREYPINEVSTVDNPTALRDEQHKWMRRHCFVTLLDASPALSPPTAASPDARPSPSHEDHFGVRFTVLRSLLGVAMCVLSEYHPHLISFIKNPNEDTQPFRVMHSSTFWSKWPQEIPLQQRRGERALLRACILPTPTLPTQCAES